jgi:polysaccharide pyruvyl transferase WcaK-like protein
MSILNHRSKGNRVRIGILDHMGYGNLGDAATQDVVLLNIRRRIPGAEIIAFSYDPEDTYRHHQIRAYPLLRGFEKSSDESDDQGENGGTSLREWAKKNLIRIKPLFAVLKFFSDMVKELKHFINSYRILKTLDLLIISGGGQLGDSYKSMPVNVFKFSFLAKLAGAKLVILNVGAGPLQYFWTKRCARWSVNLSDYASFRDEESHNLILDVGGRKNIHVLPDSVYAFEIKAEPVPPKNYENGLLVGINPSGFCDPRIWPHKDEATYRRYLGKMQQFLVWLHDNHHRIAIFSSDMGVDRYVIQDLRSGLEGKWPNDIMNRYFPSVSQSTAALVDQMFRFDCVITTKFHGIIFSHLLSKPVISLSWHTKNKVLMHEFEQDRFCLDIENFDQESLKETFILLMEQRESLVEKTREKVNEYTERLQTQFDELFSGNGLAKPILQKRTSSVNN